MLDSSARASLRSALWELRRALGDDEALVAGRDRIALRCETDLAAFDAFVAAGRLEEAVALHRGPLLADLDDDWVLEARDEHAERLGAALARLAAAADRPADAVGWARRRLALDPLDEDAARDLMRRLADAGDRPGALAAYDRLSDRLRSALGLAPSAETRALAAAVREQERGARRGRGEAARQRRAPRSSGGTTTSPPSRTSGPRSRGGAGGVAIIGGEAGIGKTRLALELLGRARADGARSARCTAADLGGGAAVRAVGGAAGRAGARARAAARRRRVAGGAGAAGAVAAAAARAAAGRRRPRCRPSSPARGCSRRRSSSPSTPPPTGRSCCCSTTSTSPTRRRSS